MVKSILISAVIAALTVTIIARVAPIRRAVGL